MRIGIVLPYAGSFVESADRLPEYEKAGAAVVYVSEAYSHDAVRQLGYIAASRKRWNSRPTSCPSIRARRP